MLTPRATLSLCMCVLLSVFVQNVQLTAFKTTGTLNSCTEIYNISHNIFLMYT